MYNSPRRPYYNRSQNMPQSAHQDDSASINNKRFWKLVNNLRGRQEEVKKDESRKPAQSGK